MSSRAAEAGRSFAVPFLVLALLILAALTGPVRAAEGDPPPVDMTPEEAFDAMLEVFENGNPWPFDADPILEFDIVNDLLLEIALLDHLGAFASPAPSFVQDIHAAYRPWPDATRELTVEFLLEVDDDLADLKAEANSIGAVTPPLAFALDELPQATRARITAGDTAFLEVINYARAVSEMLSFGNADELAAIGAPNAAIVDALPFLLLDPELARDLDRLRLDTDALRADVDELLAAPTGTAATTATSAPVAGNAALGSDANRVVAEPDTNSSIPWRIAVIAGASLLAVALLVWSIRRRRASQADDGPVTREIFEAHRRLAAALDEDQIGEIGCTTAASITEASDAFIFRQTPDGLRRIGDPTVIADTALARVVETAQPLVTVLDADPAVSSAAVCAVPLVNEGTVGAVLVVRRPTERPFGNEDRRRLEMLAPALGGALVSADTLGSYEHMALVDGLTSLGNRRRLDGDLETTLSEALATGLPVAFAMIDVDHFKQFNDTHGHEAGDRALQAVAKVIADTVRTSDVVYRYGGEEFSVLLPGASHEEATAAAERMRAAVEAARVDGEETQPGGRLTISVGVSTLETGEPGGLKTRADEALYEAKAQGRNRYVIA